MTRGRFACYRLAMHRSGPHRLASRLFVLASAASLATGCRPTLDAPFASSDGAIAAEDRRLDHGYALLFGLLADESKVADILAIKSPSEATATVLRDISAAANTGMLELRDLLAAPPVITIETDGLPIIETDARNRIANRETVALLLSGGITFERRILLTQDKACGYVAALAASLATADPDAARGERLEALADTFDRLAARVRSRLEPSSIDSATE